MFKRAKGSHVEDEGGRRYLDFFSGAGALNFGHNNDFIRSRLIDYLHDDGIMHALDMYTSAKEAFIRAMQEPILAPRGLDYRIQFTGPTGTDLNSDGDVIDGVARLVEMAMQTETNLGVAADAFAILGSAGSAQLYLVVDEAQDGKDWSGDAGLDVERLKKDMAAPEIRNPNSWIG